MDLMFQTQVCMCLKKKKDILQNSENLLKKLNCSEFLISKSIISNKFYLSMSLTNRVHTVTKSYLVTYMLLYFIYMQARRTHFKMHAIPERCLSLSYPRAEAIYLTQIYPKQFGLETWLEIL